jgi:hypothetical protein
MSLMSLMSYTQEVQKLSYLAIAKAAEARLKAERDPGAEGIDLPQELGPTLSGAYRRYWTLAESQPLEAFQAILTEIAAMESQGDPGQVIDILEAEARKFHGETGCCPHCRQMGPLHHGPDGNEPR